MNWLTWLWIERVDFIRETRCLVHLMTSLAAAVVSPLVVRIESVCVSGTRASVDVGP